MKQVGEEEFVVMRGSYQYIGADGNFFLFSKKTSIIWSEFLNNFDTIRMSLNSKLFKFVVMRGSYQCHRGRKAIFQDKI